MVITRRPVRLACACAGDFCQGADRCTEETGLWGNSLHGERELSLRVKGGDGAPVEEKKMQKRDERGMA